MPATSTGCCAVARRRLRSGMRMVARLVGMERPGTKRSRSVAEWTRSSARTYLRSDATRQRTTVETPTRVQMHSSLKTLLILAGARAGTKSTAQMVPALLLLEVSRRGTNGRLCPIARISGSKWVLGEAIQELPAWDMMRSRVASTATLHVSNLPHIRQDIGGLRKLHCCWYCLNTAVPQRLLSRVCVCVFRGHERGPSRLHDVHPMLSNWNYRFSINSDRTHGHRDWGLDRGFRSLQQLGSCRRLLHCSRWHRPVSI